MKPRLKDYIDANDSIFDALASAGVLPDVVTFTPAELDVLLRVTYGERRMFPAVMDLTISALAGVMKVEFQQAWKEYAELYDIATGPSYEKTVETLEGVETEGIDDTNTEQVSAYNSTNMVDTAGNIRNNERELSREHERTTVRTRYAMDEHEHLYEQAKVQISKRVVNDVANFLTLSVY